jgi:hypothetical protein
VNHRAVTDDDVPISSNEFALQIRDYALACVSETLNKIPTIQNRKPKNGCENWMAEAGIVINRIPFPEPSKLRSIPHLSKWFLSPVSFACCEASSEIWDLEAFFHTFLPGGGLKCHCEKLLTLGNFPIGVHDAV